MPSDTVCKEENASRGKDSFDGAPADEVIGKANGATNEADQGLTNEADQGLKPNGVPNGATNGEQGVTEHFAGAQILPFKSGRFELLQSLIKYFPHGIHARRFWDDSIDPPRWGYRPIHQPIDDQALRTHLISKNEDCLGVYFMLPGGSTMQCAVFDLDDHSQSLAWSKMQETAREIIELCNQCGLICWPVRSGGGRGMHLWLFWEQQQSATAVRSVMTLIVESVGFSVGTLGVDKGEIKIFPAQDFVPIDGKTSNLIALPFARDSEVLGPDLEPTTTQYPLLVTSHPLNEHVPKTEPVPRLTNLDIVADALATLDPNMGMKQWLEVAYALKHSFGDDGLPIWTAWSQTATDKRQLKDDAAYKARWNKIKPSGRITVGSIFHWAKEQGWRPPKQWSLPEIFVRSGEIPRIVDEAEAALLASNTNLYQSGSRLVSVVENEIKTFEGPAKALRLHTANATLITERLCNVAVFFQLNLQGKWSRTDPPSKISLTYLSRGTWRLPALRSVVNVPVIRPDGSILAEPGYDDATGLYFDPAGVTFPEIPVAPTKEQGGEALERLKRPLRDFDFVTVADRAVALSYLITGVVRSTLPAAPLHIFDAPVAGSGKSKLARMGAIVATGNAGQVLGQRNGKFGIEEFDKGLSAAMLSGATFIVFDNMDVPMDSALLCTCLTEEVVTVRPFGQIDKNTTVPCGAMFAMTGNNATIVGDLTRRAVRCSLDPQCEQPELREFAEDPVETVRGGRGQYVADCLTVVLAYRAAGSPKQGVVALGSFEMWSRTVREALMWLGEADPVETMKKLREDDPALEELLWVMSEWQAVIGDQPITAITAIAEASKRYSRDDEVRTGLVREGELMNPGFHAALLAVGSGGDAGSAGFSAKKLGRWLRRQDGRIAAASCFIRAGNTRTNTMLWKLETKDIP